MLAHSEADYVYGDLAVAGDSSALVVGLGTVTTPSVSATGGAHVQLDRLGVLRLGDAGAGPLTLRGTGHDTPTTVVFRGGDLEGTLVQSDAAVQFLPNGDPSHLDGDWRSAPGAHLTLAMTGQNSHLRMPTNLVVSGAARLRGTVEMIVSPSHNQSVGYTEVLMTAAGGLTARFTALTASEPGWQLRTNSTSIIATFVGF